VSLEDRAQTGTAEGPPSAGGPSHSSRRHVVRLDLANVALATVVVVLVVRAFSFVDVIRNVILLLVLAILLAMAIDPLVTRLRRGGMSRVTSVLGIYLVLAALVAAFVVTAADTVSRQVSLLVKDLPTLTDRLSSLPAGLPPGLIRDLATSLVASFRPEELTALLGTSLTSGSLSQVLLITVTVFEALAGTITVFVIAYFWLAERSLIRRLVMRSVAPVRRSIVLTVWNDVETKLGAWVRGQLLLMLIIGVAQGIGYTILGLPFALLLAVFAGLAEAIPMVGPYLGGIPALLVALTISPQTALLLIGYTVVLHLVESSVLVPRVMGHVVGLTPLTIVLALLAGSALGGIPGALLAIPVAAAVQVAIVDLFPATTQDEIPLPPTGGDQPTERV
jgi:predicted PurR-regulated permease PerM